MVAVSGFVYVARDGGGSVLYVGMTTNLRGRFGAHARSSSWWSLRGSIEVTECENADDARALEDDLICRFDPPYNARGGHGLRHEGCSGRRCARLRSVARRQEMMRQCRLVRQARRRSAPPLSDWDQARLSNEHMPSQSSVGPRCAARPERESARIFMAPHARTCLLPLPNMNGVNCTKDVRLLSARAKPMWMRAPPMPRCATTDEKSLTAVRRASILG